MKALTKGQYEGIGRILADVNFLTPDGGGVLYEVIVKLADHFQESDPEFKRELFIKQCGVTE